MHRFDSWAMCPAMRNGLPTDMNVKPKFLSKQKQQTATRFQPVAYKIDSPPRIVPTIQFQLATRHSLSAWTDRQTTGAACSLTQPIQYEYTNAMRVRAKPSQPTGYMPSAYASDARLLSCIQAVAMSKRWFVFSAFRIFRVVGITVLVSLCVFVSFFV